LIFCCLVLGVGALVRTTSSVTGGFGGLRLLIPPKPQDAFDSGAETFLLLGCDEDYKPSSYPSRYYSGEAGGHRTPDSAYVIPNSGRSDMMMVVRMDFDNGEITGVSVPRDTWCRLPDDKGKHKINAYYHNAPDGQKAEAAKEAVEHLIGVQIDKVIVVDFEKMQKLVDLMGGVYVNVPRKMDYDDYAGMLHIHLKPGYQKLDGYTAMGYVRFRHSKKGKAETDFQRQQREKDMLLGMKQAALGNWRNIGAITDAAAATVGDSLSDDQILALAGFVRHVGPQRIQIGVIPTEEDGNGLKLLKDKLPAVLAQYKLVGFDKFGTPRERLSFR